MRAVIYARVSTEKQEKQETVRSQLAALREYAQQKELTVIQEYVDEGYSGELLDRPALDRLRDDAKQRLFDLILVHSPDRLARKFIYIGILEEELKKSDVSVVFINRPDSKDTPEENLLNNIQGVIAEYEKAKILERTRRGRLHKAKSGFVVGSKAPYGYRYVKEERRGHYEIIPEEAAVVRLIFELFLTRRFSIRAICRELTERKIPPHHGKHWRSSSLHRIIRNETYVGTTYYNKHVSVEPTHPKNGYRRIRNAGRKLRDRVLWVPISLPPELKIIDPETFARAQEQLHTNAEFSPRNVKYRYLLRGMVRCDNCESPFYGTNCHGKLFYRCGNRHRTFPLPRTCDALMVGAGKLEDLVWNTLTTALRNPELIADQIERLKERPSCRDFTAELDQVQEDLRKIEAEEGRLLDAYRENVISIMQLKNQMARLQDRKKILRQQKEDLCGRQQAVASPQVEKSIYDYCAQISRRLDGLQDDFDGKRYLLSLAAVKVAIAGKKVKIRGSIPISASSSSPESCTVSTSSGGCDSLRRRPRRPFSP